MGNVKSQHPKFIDKRASVSSDRPSFYHRRRSSDYKQEGSKRFTLASLSIMGDSDDEVGSGNELDTDTYHHTFYRRCDKRPKSYPAVQSKKSSGKSRPHQILDSPASANSNLSEDDISRRTQMHYLLKHYFHGNYNAPIQDILRQPSSFLFNDENELKTKNVNPVRILDICCGSGVWILEMASEYPNVHCYGVNPTEAYPTMVKPSNAHFSCCDVAHNGTLLEFPENHFDFVRMEMIYKSYNKDQWKILAKEINRVLKTGGYFELRDVDPIMKHTGPVGKAFFEQYSNSVKEKLGADMDWYQHMCDYMERYGGMIDIHFQVAMLPLGWGQGQIPQILLRLVRAGLQSYQRDWLDLPDKAKDGDDVSTYKDKTKRLLEEAIQQHAYYNFYLCWGRKSYFPQTSMTVDPGYETASMKKDCDSEIWVLANGYEE